MSRLHEQHLMVRNQNPETTHSLLDLHSKRINDDVAQVVPTDCESQFNYLVPREKSDDLFGYGLVDLA